MALERNGAVVAVHFKTWGLGDDVFLITEVPISSIEHLAEFLEAQIHEHLLDVVIVDHLQNLVRIQKGNEYGEVSLALQPLSALAKRANVHILVLHHSGKTERADGEIDPLGSEAYRAAADTLIEAKKSGGQYYIRAQVRVGQDLPRTRVTINLETGKAEGIDAAEAEKGDLIDRITDWLKKRAEPSKTEEVQEAFNVRAEVLSEALRTGVETGKFVRTGGRMVNGVLKGVKGDPFLYSVPDADRDGREWNPKRAGKLHQDGDLFHSRNLGNGNGVAGRETKGEEEAQPEEIQRAIRLIRMELGNGREEPRAELDECAHCFGVSPKALEEACKRLDVSERKVGSFSDSIWMVSIPPIRGDMLAKGEPGQNPDDDFDAYGMRKSW